MTTHNSDPNIATPLRHAHRAVITGLTMALAALTAACSGIPEKAERIDRDIERVLEQAAYPAPPPAEETRELLMPEPEPAVEAPPEERFDLFVDEAPARQFLMSLVAESDWNMTVHPELRGAVSLELKNVTIPEVLEVMREVYGYEYSRNDTGFIVMPATLQTRVYEIDYLNLTRSGSSRTKVSSGQATNLPPSLLDTTGTGGYGGSGGFGGDGEDNDTASTQIETENDTQFWDDLEASVTRIVGEAEGTHVISNSQAGVLSVRAMPNEHRAVQEFLDIVQGSVQRQVILEARIIEVELRDRFRSGINWQALFEIDDVDFGVGQAAGQELFEEGASALRGNPLNVNPGAPIEGFDSTAFGGPFTLAAGSADFNGFIELLETQGKTRVLSSPRIATVNNQKAVIKVGDDEFFVTGIESQTAAGTATSTTASTVQLTPFFSGIALDVIPQISKSGDVILHVHPTVSEVRDEVKTFTTGGEEESLPLAFSTVRESDSIIRARSGQLVVIGGLMRDEAIERSIGTPGLGRLPLIGNLFNNRLEESVKTELVILIRPIVISNDDSAWTDQARRRLDRIRRLGGPAGEE